ncbi:M20/M25/M40 family metallo-hydrolase [Streptomyces sp. RY43-2]|uniref:M20/M25/M40 family metallo-hydrolase n=1 Tax=Streptomyces macrolidinus TaxID=2952607 RepID=A0ABT0ZAL1_9ACTN|nr:M20/M25/M40 family metallo-hydrolase [Streptomyces macrolidinus]MCN9240566.1 M20/M25/M40 family metallo-hydrolase [Streptomyces macrolidinus]
MPRRVAPTAPVPTAAEAEALAADAVALCSRLIRFDTSNFGAGDSRGERACAEWVAEELTDAGHAPVVLESAPGRANTVVRIPGADATAPALLVHGHLDVVPAEPADWQTYPFSGEIRDGAVWGRGALDMKDMDAMMLAFVRHLARTGTRPPRDLVLAFVADEEDTGEFGARFLVEQHPDLFEGVTAAISESGGHSVHLPGGSRLYPIAAGERGSAWMTITARGTAGHGSRRNDDNALVKLAAALGRFAAHEWPVRLVPIVEALLDGLSQHLGIEIDPADLGPLGAAAPLVAETLANSVNPTMLRAGYKHNVIPSEAAASLDGRILPGAEAEFFETIDALLGPDLTRTGDYQAPVSADHTAPDFAAMAAALRAHDPDALVLPYCMTGGTDAKAFADLGIPGFGFVPGRTPSDFDAWRYVHGVDEHVLTDSLGFGARVLTTYLMTDPRAFA